MGSRADSEGIHMESKTIVKRVGAVNAIIENLLKNNVLLVKSPPMTGKTSMATLVGNALHAAAVEKTLIMKISMVQLSRIDNNWEFQKAFDAVTKCKWSDLVPLSSQRLVYLIFDEVQLIYQPKPKPDGNRETTPNNKSRVFWEMIKAIISDETSRIRVLLFAAYGSSVHNFQLSTPVQFDEGKTMAGIEILRFNDDELREYVEKNLKCLQYVDPIQKPVAVAQFCNNLGHYTGFHAGLIYTVVKAVNEEFSSDMKYRNYKNLSAAKIASAIYLDSVYEQLTQTRACSRLSLVTEDEMASIRLLMLEGQALPRDDIASSLTKLGVLVESKSGFGFSSPVVHRYFLGKVLGAVQTRADVMPTNLRELINRALLAIDYKHLKESLGKTKKTDILLERAWQMAFYRAVIRCTPHDLFISPDVGALFNTAGAIDFTVHSKDMSTFWGIELLREADRLNGHIERFAKGGRYEKLAGRFSDSCLVDFRLRRGVKSFEKVFEKDLHDCGRLFIVSYDLPFDEVIIYDGESQLQGRRVNWKNL
ncbi:hypothetical protein HK101_005403 [Irineochytrium annulatum]|nr:hypothetical protein HK101_005403 [Irineochytrium annulatum]